MYQKESVSQSNACIDPAVIDVVGGAEHVVRTLVLAFTLALLPCVHRWVVWVVCVFVLYVCSGGGEGVR